MVQRTTAACRRLVRGKCVICVNAAVYGSLTRPSVGLV